MDGWVETEKNNNDNLVDDQLLSSRPHIFYIQPGGWTDCMIWMDECKQKKNNEKLVTAIKSEIWGLTSTNLMKSSAEQETVAQNGEKADILQNTPFYRYAQ